MKANHYTFTIFFIGTGSMYSSLSKTHGCKIQDISTSFLIDLQTVIEENGDESDKQKHEIIDTRAKNDS